MEEYSKCALGTYYYTGTLSHDGSAIYTQSQKEYKACSLGYMEPIILKDWDTNTWIGTVRKFSYMKYCVPYKWIWLSVWNFYAFQCKCYFLKQRFLGNAKEALTWLKSSCSGEKIEDCRPHNWQIRKGRGSTTWYVDGLSLVFSMF